MKRPESPPPSPAQSSTRDAFNGVPARDPASPQIRQPTPSRASFLRSFVYAWRGIAYAVRTQRNMRVHLALGVLAVALGIALRLSAVEFALIFLAITGVLVTEMLNTVTESVVDLVTDQYHPLARVAKDVAAGVVLVNAMLAVVIALFVFGPHLWALARYLLRW